jgi:gas vesicle protein
MSGKGSKILLAGLAGIAAGVALGLLFAPAKGSRTRKRLKKSLREFSESDGKSFSEKVRSFASGLTSEEDEKDDAG